MAEKLALTMASVDRLKPLKNGRRWTYDTKVAGLAVCTTATGAKSLYLYKKVNGKPERHLLGKFPEVSVDAARDKANKLLAKIADGLNPAEAKRKLRGELTLGKLWTLYLEFHAPHKKASSVAEDRRLWKRYLQPWESRKLSSVADGDVRKLHSRIGQEHGKYAANRALALLSTMFNVAKEHGELKTPNPCEGVKKFAEISRDRFLLGDELPRFVAALDAADNQVVADAFRLMLYTGARKMNVLGMRWADVDLKANVWRIPDTKGGEPLRVPLVPAAVEVLNRRRAAVPDAVVFVFPSKEAGSLSGHVENVTMHWKAVRDAAGLPDLRCHDLRRTMGSWQAAGGASLQVIGKSLGHKNASTTEIYARLQLDPVREAMEKAAAAMTAAAAVTTKAEG